VGRAAAPTRASGKTAADEAAANEAKNGMAPVEPVGDPIQGGVTGGAVTRPEDVHMSMTPAFSRMRTDWNSPDRDVIQQMHRGADVLIRNEFGEIMDLFFEVYMIVREPVMKLGTVDEPVTDAFGYPEWQKVPGTDSYAEDWTRLGWKERENLLFKITTGIFRWTQRRDQLWADAMFSRAQFEERFALGYEEIKNEKATIDDRTARARRVAAEYRYYAVYASYLSRRADSVVKSAELLGQRLKDVSSQ
jgi:hypothetical protein